MIKMRQKSLVSKEMKKDDMGFSVNWRIKMSDVCNEKIHISHVDSAQDSF
jgi:hypothetical protein